MSSARSMRLFRDPIYNVIAYDTSTLSGRLMLRLIDAAEFQRLRHIRQLGLASLVYPSAEHSRFSHSMGVAHLARKICGVIHRGEKPDEIRVLATCAAALLHDVGHAPFSHALEPTLQEVLGFSGSHEVFSERIILWEGGEINATLRSVDPEFPQMVADYIGHRTSHYTAPIVSSQLDADRMDYLLRDGHMTGVKNHHYDAERILEMLGHDDVGLIVDKGGLLAVESYLLSRSHMYQQIYYHKALRSAEVILAAIFRRALELLVDGCSEVSPRGPLGRLFQSALQGEEPSTENYLRLNDHHGWVAIQEWSEHKDPILSDLCQRLERRRLFKSVEIPEKELERFQGETLSEVREVVRNAGFDPNYYVALDQAESIPFKPYDMTDGEAIRIGLTGGRIAPIEEVSPLVASLSSMRNSVFRCCFPSETRREVERLIKTRHPSPLYS